MIDGVGGLRLLRSHVGGGAESHAHRGELVSTRGFTHGFGDPEVGHERMTTAEHDVVGLDVAVDDSVMVCVCQGVHDVA